MFRFENKLVMAEKCDIIDGNKGGLDILIGGYKLNRGKVNKNGTMLCRCRDTGCRASLITTSDGTVAKCSNNMPKVFERKKCPSWVFKPN